VRREGFPYQEKKKKKEEDETLRREKAYRVSRERGRPERTGESDKTLKEYSFLERSIEKRESESFKRGGPRKVIN